MVKRMTNFIKLFEQAKPLVPRLPQTAVRIHEKFELPSHLVWFTGTVQPIGNKVIICLSETQYDSVIDTVHPNNGATQGLFLKQIIECSNETLSAVSCVSIDGLSEINNAGEISNLLNDPFTIKAVHQDFNLNHMLNIAWTNQLTNEVRWTPIFIKMTALLTLELFSDGTESKNKHEYLRQKLLKPSDADFGEITVSMFDFMIDELLDWDLTEITYGNADDMDRLIHEILQGKYL
jgi:hypothetical protein